MPEMSLASITVGAPPAPPRVVIYGEHGVGKTEFGVSAPNPIVLRTEDGLAARPVPTFPIAIDYRDVMAALTTLYLEAHGFLTLIVDSLDWLEPIIWRETAARHGERDIESFGYGKGYVRAAEVWGEFLEGLNALRTRGITVICLAHEEIKRFDAPDTEPYDRYQIKLHKRAADLVQEWADVVGFAHYEIHTVAADVGFNKTVTRAVGAGNRVLSLEERPAFHAKNRYQLPAELPLTARNEAGRVVGGWPQFAAACAAAFTQEVGTPAFAPVAAVVPEPQSTGDNLDMPAEPETQSESTAPIATTT